MEKQAGALVEQLAFCTAKRAGLMVVTNNRPEREAMGGALPAVAELRAGADFTEAARAFAEKRSPTWKT